MIHVTCLMVLLCLLPQHVYAQEKKQSTWAMVTKQTEKPDTLSIMDRISVRTNVVDWGLMVPNVGAEFDIRGTNWNRWSAGFNIRWRPKGTASIIKPVVFDLFEVTLEGREYWRERKCTTSGYLSPHERWYQKLLSCRNKFPSHPYWIFYRGGYMGYSQYSNMFGDKGYQGTAYMAGFTWGFVKPFLAFSNGNSMDLEFGISGGAILTSYDTYTHDEYNNCYRKTGHEDSKFMPMIRDIHVGLVYRIGKYPMQKKYRWRYDVDMNYKEKKDARYLGWVVGRNTKHTNDSIYNRMLGDFRILYDSCVVVRHVENQNAINEKAPQRIVKTLKRQVEDSLYLVKVKRDMETMKRKIAKKRQREEYKRQKAEQKRLFMNERDKRKSKSRYNNIDENHSVDTLNAIYDGTKAGKLAGKKKAALEERAKKKAEEKTSEQKYLEKVTKDRAAAVEKDKKAADELRAKAAAEQKAIDEAKAKDAEKEVNINKKDADQEKRKKEQYETKRKAIKAKIDALKK